MKRSSQWPKNADGTTYIEVSFENPEGNEREISLIKNAIENSWAKYANIKFYNWGKVNFNQSGIRILVNNKRDMSKEAWPHTSGLGNELNGIYGGMTLNFNWPGFPKNISNDNAIMFTAVHEFGHALGLAHEQRRQDTKCDCLYANKDDVEKGGEGGDWFFLPCDYYSVMNYCNPNWNNWGVLSELDIVGIQTIYGENPNLNSRLGNKQTINIIDNLGREQTWENLFIILGNEQRMLHVDRSNIHDVIQFFNKTGNTYYKVWSTSYYNDKILKGYGEGYIFIPDNSVSTYEVLITEDFVSGLGKLTLNAVYQ